MGTRSRRLAALSAIVLYGSFGQAPVLQNLDGGRIQPPLDGISVFLFTRTDCPISNRYAPEVNRLHGRFAAAGVRFWLVYVDPKQEAADIRAHLREYAYSADALQDGEHGLVRFTGATVTPEAAVYVGRRLVYRKETPMCNLFLTMMDRMGTRREHFGDSTGHLEGLDVA